MLDIDHMSVVEGHNLLDFHIHISELPSNNLYILYQKTYLKWITNFTYRRGIDIGNKLYKYEKCKVHYEDRSISNLEGKENIHDILQHRDVEADKLHSLDEEK